MRVVFSIDLASTRTFGVRGELASLSGLKLMTALRMRLDVEGRVRTRMGRQFSVPSTMSASLQHNSLNQFLGASSYSTCGTQSYLLLSWSTLSILSRRPVASASSCLGSRNGWPGGIIPKEISRPFMRCS